MKYNFCPNCGFKLNESFKFCPMCGESLGEGQTVQPQAKPEQPSFSYEQPAPKEQSNLDKAVDLFKNQEYAAALSYLIDYAGTDDIEVIYMIGYCLYKTKKYDASCEKFLRLAADRGHPLAQAALGELYYCLAEDSKIADFEKGYDPYMGISKDQYDEAKANCEMYYSLALKYLSMAKGNGAN
ncbi:MAG: zinc-ribbon domain-containing protein [Anaeroplasmataceae bacterium]|nr:zinc-ribbon domain-containing protein [Anaeroplasmataceae bacterium]